MPVNMNCCAQNSDPSAYLLTFAGLTACCVGSTKIQDLSSVVGPTFFVPLNAAIRYYSPYQLDTYASAFSCNNGGSPTGSVAASSYVTIQAGGIVGATDRAAPGMSGYGVFFNSALYYSTSTVNVDHADNTATNGAVCGVSHGSQADAATGGTVFIHPIYADASLSPSSASFTNSGGTGSITITMNGTGEWYAGIGTSAFVDIGTGRPTDWVSITSATSGSGNDTLSYSVAANATGSTRSARIWVNNTTLTINQSA